MLAVIHKVCKNHKRYKIKELLFKTSENVKSKQQEEPRLSLRFLTIRGRWEWMIFFFFNFNFLTKLRKNICYARTLTAEPPTLSYELVRF